MRLSRALVPSLLLQPLVENSVRHALEPYTGSRDHDGGHHARDVKPPSDRRHRTTGQDGRYPPPGGRGMGLANTRARLLHLYGAAPIFRAGPRIEWGQGSPSPMVLPSRRDPRPGCGRRAAARDLLKSLLIRVPDITVVGEAADGREAVSATRPFRPDLVFLDVSNAELDGFGALIAEIGGPDACGRLRHRLRSITRCAAFEVHARTYCSTRMNPEPASRRRYSNATERGCHERAAEGAARTSCGTGRGAPVHQVALRIRFIDISASTGSRRTTSRTSPCGQGGARDAIHTFIDRAPTSTPRRSCAYTPFPPSLNAHADSRIQPWFHNDYVVINVVGL